jgi:hypothetical protein
MPPTSLLRALSPAGEHACIEPPVRRTGWREEAG